MDVCVRVLKESNKRSFDSCNVSNSVIHNWSYPRLPLGMVVCIFLPTTFLEIAVYIARAEYSLIPDDAVDQRKLGC